MIGALEALQRSVEPEHMPEQVAALGISGVRKGGLRMLFASHPPMEDRIAATPGRTPRRRLVGYEPLSLWERVASFRPKPNPSPFGRGWPKAG